MTNVLITGGLGFIGSHTVDVLRERGFNVSIYDNCEKQVHGKTLPEYYDSKIEFIKGDIRHKRHLEKALEGKEVVIHLASMTGSSQSLWQPSKYVSANITGTANLFEAIILNSKIKRRMQKIVMASSSYIYGEGTYNCELHGTVNPPVRTVDQLKSKEWEISCPFCHKPVTPVGTKETKPFQMANVYSLSKYASEVIGERYAAIIGIPVVSFRYFNVYGPRQSLINPYTGVISVFISRLKSGRKPIIFEDGLPSRDFVYVKDVAMLNYLAIHKGEGVINLGSGKRTSIIDIFRNVKNSMGTDIEPEISQEGRIGDIRHIYSDNSKLIKYFGSPYFTGITEGINDTVSWSILNKSKDYFSKVERLRKRYTNW